MDSLILKDVGAAHVIYTVSRPCGEVVYFGHCPLAQLAQLPDMRWHSYAGMFFDNEEIASKAVVRIAALFPEWDEQAFNYYWDLISLHGANRNLNAQYQDPPKAKRGRKTRKVIEIDKGYVFESAAEVCREYGIRPSNLSVHLQGIGHSINGMRFKYVDD